MIKTLSFIEEMNLQFSTLYIILSGKTNYASSPLFVDMQLNNNLKVIQNLVHHEARCARTISELSWLYQKTSSIHY
jgi:hypothetical protein